MNPKRRRISSLHEASCRCRSPSASGNNDRCGSGGTSGACNGTLSLDWNAYQMANPTSLGNPWAVGNKAYAQAWFRDPPAVKTTNLSDGLELTYVP